MFAKFGVTRARRRVLGVLRVGVLLGVSNLLVAAFLLPRARAGVEEKLRARGLMLLDELGPALVGPPEAASINGQRMWLAFKATSLPVPEVLSRFERHCEASGPLIGELASLPITPAALERLPAELRNSARWFTSRQSELDESAGQVVCFARREREEGLAALVRRIGNFLDTGDLAAIGDARYAVARRDQATGETQLLTIWTEGSFNIPKLFEESGDSPGSDSPVIPRPPLSRRVLSAEIVGRPYALRMYDSARSAERVLSFYTEHMTARGFRSLTLPRAANGQDLVDQTGVFVNDTDALLVVVDGTPENATGVTLIEMGGQGFVRASAKEGSP